MCIRDSPNILGTINRRQQSLNVHYQSSEGLDGDQTNCGIEAQMGLDVSYLMERSIDSSNVGFYLII